MVHTTYFITYSSIFLDGILIPILLPFSFYIYRNAIFFIAVIMYIVFTFSEILVLPFYSIILQIRANDLEEFKLTKRCVNL